MFGMDDEEQYQRLLLSMMNPNPSNHNNRTMTSGGPFLLDSSLEPFFGIYRHPTNQTLHDDHEHDKMWRKPNMIFIPHTVGCRNDI
jgi:hypothetical protein